jgi:hypothetical protein
MSLILDGTNGLSDVDGSAATPAIRGSDANTGVFFGTDIVGVSTGGTERMRVDASGNVGIGTSSGSTFGKFAVSGADDASLLGLVSATGVLRARAYNTATTGALIESTNAAQSAYANLFVNGLNLLFGTGNTERMRIDSSGNLLVGTTSTANAADGFRVLPASNGGMIGIGHVAGTGSGNAFAVFGLNGAQIGSISQNGTTAVAYNTSSDYRLKHNIQPMTGALTKVAALKPCTYKWNADGSDGQGFIAHELQAVVPECVTGEKDAVNEDGSIKPQGIDTSFLVATLTAAIKEQQAIITALTARVEALEGAQA